MRLFSFIALSLCLVRDCYGQVQVGLLRSSDVKSALTLHYLKGNCSWRSLTNIGGFVKEEELRLGPRIKIQGVGQNFFNLKCVVDENVQLHSVITLYDTVPAPENVTLDTNNTLLKWNHVFQPSDLPPDFELVHDYNTTYLVHVSYRNDVDTHRSVNVSGSRSLNLDEEPVVLNGCEEQEFAVQAVINNELYSQNSSIVSGNNVPIFRRVSASLELTVRNVFNIQVSFVLLWKQCLSVFTLTVLGLRNVQFNVTATDIEKGRAEFILPLNVSDSLEDVCSLRGVVFGGKDVGNTMTADILLPSDCQSLTSLSSGTTMVSTRSVVTTVPSPTPTSPTVTSSTKSSKGVSSAIIAAVVAVLVVVALVILIIIAIIFLVKKNKVVPKLGPSSEYRSVAEYRSTLADSAGREENPKGSNYTDVMTVKMPDEKIPAVSDDKSVYTTVDHVKTEKRRRENEAARAAHPESDSKPKEISIDPKDVGLSLQLHLQPLLEVLQPVKAVWYKLGMHLNLSENFLDETETNIETNEECLSDMLKNWLQYHEPSLEMLNHALSKIDWQPITFDATIKGFVFVSGREEEGKGEGEGEERPAIPERNF